MRAKFGWRFISLSVLMAVQVVAGSAMASRNFSALMAVPNDPTEAGCFDHLSDGIHLGWIRNSGCTGTRAVWLPLAVDSGGWPSFYPVNISVTVEGFTPAPGQEVACGLYSVNEGGTITAGPWGNIPFAQDSVTLGPVVLQNQRESAVIMCFLPSGSIVFNYHY